MPKINVYLPDDLAEAVKEAGLTVSPICQRALEQAVRRVTAIRAAAAHDPRELDEAGRLARFTARARTVLRLAADRAEAEQAPTIGTGHLLGGLLAEGGNLALQVLGALEITDAQVAAGLGRADLTEPVGPAGAGAGLRLSGPAAEVLEQTVNEAEALGHNYVGCEHLLLGLIAEREGLGGGLLRELGADQRTTRRAVAAALAGYVHLRANHPTPQSGAASQPSAGQVSAGQLEQLGALIQQQLKPVIERIERLEARAEG
ncbi:Clp protease N-terminal domain-containing protein [Kitasatospora sp. LaBMicrA B282]|uniref:Clp protease N-terminal domain-containing protein n=1 Tax=Kitasatospora sp. LaBMicrA B282 TaxID=3420949 RepID=UPI003D10F04E